jgi:hypothetical protein
LRSLPAARAELAGGAEDSYLVRSHDRDACRVVAAVLEAAQTIEENRHHLF